MLLKKSPWIILALLFLNPLIALSDQTSSVDSLIIKLKEKQKSAVNEGSIDSLKTIQQKWERLESFGDKSYLIHYYRALNYYRIGNILYSQDREEEREKYLKEAKESIVKSIEENDDFAESHSLYSAILGQEISLNPTLGMINGMKSGKARARAYKLDPDNPRTYLIDGIGKLYTPSMFGGGADAALEKLEEAEQLFKEEGDRGTYPDWGKGEVYIWLGQAWEKKGDKDKALKFYRKALSINPENEWASTLLEKFK